MFERLITGSLLIVATIHVLPAIGFFSGDRLAALYHPDDVARFGIQNVIASMQPYHAIDDGRWAEGVIGTKRIKTTYVFDALIDSGALADMVLIDRDLTAIELP